MPRCGRLRSFIREYNESRRNDRISFLLPFFVLSIEIILLYHAITIIEGYVIVLTSLLLTLSIIEITLVSREAHKRYQQINFDRILTIRLDDFITKTRIKNVKIIVEDFIEQYPEYKKHRSQIYRTSCQILETHKEEATGKNINEKLEPFVKRRKKKTVDELLTLFLKRYPKYKKNRDIIYERICVLKNEK